MARHAAEGAQQASFDVDDGPAGRILRSARDILATQHYSGRRWARWRMNWA